MLKGDHAYVQRNIYGFFKFLSTLLLIKPSVFIVIAVRGPVVHI